MNRYIILLASVIMQMCLGATYAWSMFVEPIKKMTGLSQGSLQIPFAVFYFVFPFTLLFANRLSDRFGPRTSAVLGGIVFGGGWLLAGLGNVHFLFTILGIGALGGLGVGLIYLVPITVGLRWFPDHKGLVTGVTVAGFGGGAALISQIAGLGLNTWILSPFELFAWLGLAFLVLIILGGLFMRYPSSNKIEKIQPLKVREIIRQPAFRVLYFGMFCGLAAGLSVNANLKELSGNLTLESGAVAVSLFAIANALGRISWGALFDRVHSNGALKWNLLFQAILLFTGSTFIGYPFGLEVFAFVAGFNYGGILVLYASTIAREWGAERVNQVYGLLFSVHFFATTMPLLSGFAFDLWGSFQIAFYFLGTLLIFGVVVLNSLKNLSTAQ